MGLHSDLTRRALLRSGGLSLGAIAVGQLLGEARAQDGPLVTRSAPGRARAKRVIYLQMSGAPPQIDLFDHKPKLQQLHGELCPDSFLAGRRLAFIKGHPTLLGSPHRFHRTGPSGLPVSELLPHFRSIANDVCVVRSMHTDQFNHAPADLLQFTGSPQPGAAALGSWVTYGLGTENQDLPGFMVLVSGGSDPTGGKSTWSSGFLPSVHQGVRLRGKGDPVLYVSNPDGMDRALRRRSLDALRELNELEAADSGDPETDARIEQFELAYRMQATVPDVMDIAREPAAVIEEYGAQPGLASFANNCLLARRLVERGVRFVQLYDWGWDMHGTDASNDLVSGLPMKCAQVDRPIAALVSDLKRRGLLEETLVVWGGEFGRTSMNEKRGGSTYLGRDHHPDCFSMWLAGAGVNAGYVHGETDELGYNIVRDPVSVQDMQATILHVLGFDPFRFRYRYQGLEQRLIGPASGPRIVHELFA